MKTQIEYDSKTIDIDYDILAPGIYAYHNAIPKKWNCIDRIEDALSIPNTRFKWKQAGLSYGDTDLDHRKCKDFKINEEILLPRDVFSSDMLDLHQEIIYSLKTILFHYCSENYLAAIKYFECINIVRYGKGEFFKVHSDDGEPYRCTVSCVGYPNDNYEGGELWFPKFNIKYKPIAGDFVLCPSAYVYAHSSEPVTDDGVKYSFVIMTDRNKFAHRNDSPVYHPTQLREKYNVI